MSTSLFPLPRRCAVAFLLAAAAFGQAPPEIVARIADEASEEKSRVMDHLSELCLGIGPRLTGSQNLVKASEWAAQKFLSYGLSVRLDKWTDVETGFDRGVHTGFAFWSDATESRPAEGGRRRRGFGGDGQRGRRLVFGTDAWTGGTDGLKTGPALRVPEDESGLAALRESARGAWLVRVAGSLDSRSKALTDFIAETGAYGVVSASPGGELIRTGGRLRTKWEERSPLVRINLHGDDHKHVADLLTAGREVVLAFDVQNRYRQGPVPAYNVVAELRGVEKPEELVIVGGHLDSWDGAMGTTDNGTGVATTIEAARLLTTAGARPKRTRPGWTRPTPTRR